MANADAFNVALPPNRELLLKSTKELTVAECENIHLGAVVKPDATGGVRGALWKYFTESFTSAKLRSKDQVSRIVLKYPDDIALFSQEAIEDGMLEALLSMYKATDRRAANLHSLQDCDRTVRSISVPVERGVIRGDTTVGHEMDHAKAVYDVLGVPTFAVIPFQWQTTEVVQALPISGTGRPVEALPVAKRSVVFKCIGGTVLTDELRQYGSKLTDEQYMQIYLAPGTPSSTDYAVARHYAEKRGCLESYRRLCEAKAAMKGPDGALTPVTSDLAEALIFDAWKKTVHPDAVGLSGFRNAPATK